MGKGKKIVKDLILLSGDLLTHKLFLALFGKGISVSIAIDDISVEVQIGDTLAEVSTLRVPRFITLNAGPKVSFKLL